MRHADRRADKILLSYLYLSTCCRPWRLCADERLPSRTDPTIEVSQLITLVGVACFPPSTATQHI